tara:strand:+ start:1261 stop:1377 length:117 start_codon:yes stop_codon:yes gene_type:complete
MNFVQKLKTEGKIKGFATNFVVQSENYFEISDFDISFN